MSSLKETNTYSPSITAVDANNDVPNNQLANRTLYLKTLVDNLQSYVNTFKNDNTTTLNSLQKSVASLQSSLNTLAATSGAMDEKSILATLATLTTTIQTLQSQLATHTHNYAGSAKPGGDAATINIADDSISKTSLVGVTDINPNKLRKNNNISMENNVLSSEIFKGNLNGVADTAKTLYYKPKITLSGDVLGTINFVGDTDVVINTTLKEQTVSAGEYGSLGNYTLSSTGSFTVPDITVNSSGMITKIRNRTISLPSDLGINGITSSENTDKKIYVLGASEQSEHAQVFSRNGIYIKDGMLYSSDSQVVNLNGFQAIKNKTYEGYELGDACARGVDETVGGTKDDNRLVTSNSLYRHKHKYAMSDSVDGKASYSDITIDNKNLMYMVGNNDNNGKLLKNTNIYMKENGLFSNDLTAKDNMYIPGGKIWIDSVEVPVDENAWAGNADISSDTSDYAHKTREVSLADGLTVFDGTLLAYKANGYVLADNKDINTCDNVVIAATDGVNGTVKIIDFGVYTLADVTHDGMNCYVGNNGEICFGELQGNGIYNKKIGYVEHSHLIFNPSQYAVYLK